LPILISHGDRLVGVDETRKNVWFTAQQVYGEAPWWTPLFQFPVDPGGFVTGLASMDGRLYVAKRDRWFYVDGDGPVDSGANPYGLPQPVRGAVGCIEPRSVVVTVVGIFYQADQGIYALTPSHELQFVGRGVEQSMQGATVTSAVDDPIHGRVYFTITTAGDTVGKRLVYDYVHGIWTTDSIPGVVPMSAALIGGMFTGTPSMYQLGKFGQVYKERPVGDGAYYLDDTNWITATIETGWFKADGEQGYGRVREVRLLSENQTDHDLSISVGYNYATAYTDPRTWQRATIDALTTTHEQLAVGCTLQKTESIRILITDATPTGGTIGTGAGPGYIGIAFVASQEEGGAFPLPDGNRQ
jgi:hypothetical protein